MQKVLLIVIALFISYNYILGQQMVEIQQETLNVKYNLPKDWWYDGFGGINWDDGGSSVCQCSGTINGNDEIDIRMVIYPYRKGYDISRRMQVWNYLFTPAKTSEKVKTKNLKFRKQTSVWQNFDKNYDHIVWQFTGKTKKIEYIIYFWGPVQAMNQNKDVLMTILESITPLD